MVTHKKIFLLLSFLMVSSLIFSQGSHFLKLETNLSHDITDEVNLRIDFRHSKNLGLYFGLGYNYYNNFVRSSFLVGISPSQWDSPILAYSGPVIRLGFFISHYKERKTKTILHYFKAGLIYKNLSYKNRTFSDSDGDGYMFNFNRDEKASVYGADLILGHSKALFETSHIFFDWHFGLGVRYKYREFTINHSWGDLRMEDAAVGQYTEYSLYPIVLFGVSIGIDLKKNSKNKSHNF